MQLTVTVEEIPGRQFLARATQPFDLCAEASTRDEALDRLRELIHARLESGLEVVTLQIPNGRHAPAGDQDSGPTLENFTFWRRLETQGRATLPGSMSSKPDASVEGGDLADSPLYQEWVEAMAEARRSGESGMGSD